MTGRDRIVLTVLAALAIVALAWIEVVSPERKRASSVESKVTAAEVALSNARTQLASAKEDEKRFASAYSSVVSLGEAVPAAEEVSSLVYAVDRAAGKAKVEFQSITAGGGSSTASATPTTATASTSAGFQQLPFTFTFVGTFFDLYHMMQRLQSFTVATASGNVKVSGRLLTVNGLSLTAATSGETAGGDLTGTVTATAYVLPAGETLTAGATPSGPSGLDASSTATGSAASTPAPAVVKVGP
jgi:Tfp pilus assembly protein PilO